MFNYIKIEGFRSFKHVELELSPLSVLIGPNNGGKSNFLDLMSLMAEAGQGHLEQGIDLRGGPTGIGFGFGFSGRVQVEFHFRDLPYFFPASRSPVAPHVTFRL